MTASTVRSTAIFAIATMLSRLTGLARDSLFANYFGTSAQYDAYLVAIMIPFFLRKIFADGALTMAFVPVFNEKLKISRERAFVFASTVIVFVVIVAGSISAGGMVFSEGVASVFAGGFDKDALDLTSRLIRISFPFIALVSLWAVYCGVLNSLDAFFIAAVSPMFINLSTIAGILLSERFSPPIVGPTIGFLAGGVIQLVVVALAAKSKGFVFKPGYSKSDVREFLILFLFSAVSPAINEINSFVDVRVSTELGRGAVSSLGYAQRLYQLPLGVFAVAVATVALPRLSKLSGSDARDRFRKALWDSLTVLAFLIIPSTLGLLVLGEGIVRILFERGSFTPSDTAFTTSLLYGYTLGLPFYGSYGVLSRAYYARKSPRTPTIISAIMVSVNVALDILLGFTIGPLGVALATSVAGIVGTVTVSVALFRWSGYDREKIIAILKIILASLVMSCVMIVGRTLFGTGFISTSLTLVAGIIVYFLSARILRVGNLFKLRDLLRNKKSSSQ
ncbi:integral membrane protein MviN [Mesotoga prima MesG1.Ag.4.2]|uniref:Probable lipid II flippase MurJ n=1 Tax=Mesotoga prima MesG1.Ag.4.2 TaxID=660470 RepID=I2F3I5_9BACT|nr:murein biosynthesis integral membrane protein MurJ [Mesotoga prima]AFK06488.1 integral membrane protein MviN [Mesotoga prima MesG1.Ag.4.2]